MKPATAVCALYDGRIPEAQGVDMNKEPAPAPCTECGSTSFRRLPGGLVNSGVGEGAQQPRAARYILLCRQCGTMRPIFD